MLNGGIAFLCGGGATVFVHVLGLLGLAGEACGGGFGRLRCLVGGVFQSLVMRAGAYTPLSEFYQLRLSGFFGFFA